MPPAQKPSLAELQKLEHAFATDPQSEAYRPLAEAYLAMGRFMEAMVVCKKGVKAHPDRAAPRVLLARVYAEQGKDKKAIEELDGALQVAPTDGPTLRMLAGLKLKVGEGEAGRALLQRAYQADPADAETAELMRQHGLAPQPMAPPPQYQPQQGFPGQLSSPAYGVPQVPGHGMPGQVPQGYMPPGQMPPGYGQQPGQLAPGTMPATGQVPQYVPASGQFPAVPQSGQFPALPQSGQFLAPGQQAPYGGPRYASPAQGVPQAQPQPPPPQQPQIPARPAPPRPSSPQGRPRSRPVAYEESLGPGSEMSEMSIRTKANKKRLSAQRGAFYLLIFAVPLAAAAYYGIGQYRARLIRDANALNRTATEKVKSDTYKSYQDAIADAEQALLLDATQDTNRNARGLLAYAYTVRWGEHQRDEANRENAGTHLTAGLEAKEASSYLHAADALMDYYQGNTAEGLKKIDARIAAAEADRKQVSLYYLTKGILETNSGDLEDARTSLEKAQAINPDDPRVYAALGNLHRRRGSDQQALLAFAAALKYQASHADAMLGFANVILDQENPERNYITASKYLKSMLEAEPPPSPRQLAQAHFVTALLVSRVSRDLKLYEEKFRVELAKGTGVSDDPAAAAQVVAKEENEGLTLDRNNPELLAIRARRLAWEGRLDDATLELKKAIEMAPSAAHYHVELAKVLMRKDGGEPAAEDALKKALSMVQDSPKLLSMLGQVQYRQKKLAEAQVTLEKATTTDAQRNPEARFLLGRIYKEKKEFDPAVKLLERASQEFVGDTTQAATALDELAQTLEARNGAGDRDRARASYEKALNTDKAVASPYCNLARMLSRSTDGKDREKARALAQEYLKLDKAGQCAPEMVRLAEG